jgi:hypothetical protein
MKDVARRVWTRLGARLLGVAGSLGMAVSLFVPRIAGSEGLIVDNFPPPPPRIYPWLAIPVVSLAFSLACPRAAWIPAGAWFLAMGWQFRRTCDEIAAWRAQDPTLHLFPLAWAAVAAAGVLVLLAWLLDRRT